MMAFNIKELISVFHSQLVQEKSRPEFRKNLDHVVAYVLMEISTLHSLIVNGKAVDFRCVM